MKKFIKNIISFTFIFILSSIFLNFFADNYLVRYSKFQWLFQKENENYDVVVLGSSRVKNIINVNLLSEELNVNDINLGTSGSNFADNYIVLLKFLKKNKIKNLILNVDQFTFNSELSYSYPFHDFEFLKYFNDSEIKKVFKDYIPMEKYYLWQIIPVAKYLEFLNKYSIVDFEKQRMIFEQYEHNKGFISFPNYIIGKFKARKQILGLDKLDKKYFFKIIELCKKENINVVLITTPMLMEVFEYKKNSNLSFDFIKRVAVEKNIPYIHYSEVGNFEDRKYFKDLTHMNKIGADIYCTKLSLKIRDLIKN